MVKLPENLGIETKPWRNGCILLSVILFMGACSLTSVFYIGLPDGEIGAIIIGVLLFAMAVWLLSFLPSIFRRKISLSLTHQGINYHSMDTQLTIPWKDIEAIGTYKDSVNCFL